MRKGILAFFIGIVCFTLVVWFVFAVRDEPNGQSKKIIEFCPDFRYSPATGLGPEKGICRRDPSDVIKVGSKYYVWYTKVYDKPGIFIYPSGYSGTVWYATSPNGRTWTECGEALGKGGEGTWDEYGVYTPNILAAEGKYYLSYDGAPKPFSSECSLGEGMAISDSPDGPWKRFEGNPINWTTDDPENFDSFRVCDACLIVRDGKYWWYYKGRQIWHTAYETKMGVAISDNPTGPYVKYEANPIIGSGHEVLVWPYREGVVALVGPTGPEKNTIQYAPDGLNFSVATRLNCEPPRAPGAYRPDAFTNTTFGKGIQWGISMVVCDEPYLVRYDCNLDIP